MAYHRTLMIERGRPGTRWELAATLPATAQKQLDEFMVWNNPGVVPDDGPGPGDLPPLPDDLSRTTKEELAQMGVWAWTMVTYAQFEAGLGELLRHYAAIPERQPDEWALADLLAAQAMMRVYVARGFEVRTLFIMHTW